MFTARGHVCIIYWMYINVYLLRWPYPALWRGPRLRHGRRRAPEASIAVNNTITTNNNHNNNAYNNNDNNDNNDDNCCPPLGREIAALQLP